MPDWKTEYRDKIAGHAHDKWVELKKSEGLVYGEQRTDTTHPHLISWDELPDDQRWSDYMAADAAIEKLDELGLLIKPDFTQELRDKAVMYSVNERENQFDVKQFVGIEELNKKGNSRENVSFCVDWMITSFPQILAGKDFNALIDAIVVAHDQSKPVILFVGGHVIKCGLGPILIDMMKRNVVTHIAMNGAAAIHDIEFAMYGHSSEWVKDLLPEGKWGMWEETGEVVHEGITGAYNVGTGMSDGLSVVAWHHPNYIKYSLLASIWNQTEPFYPVPLSVHVAIGCDVIHQHPQACFEYIGATSGRDFYKLVKAVSGLDDGGVFINFGSSAMGPEVFSKALNLARNTGHEVKNFTTANFDIVELPERLSRAKKNIIDRPHIGSDGKGYNFVGSHEIMIPLLWHGVMGRL